jgi:hypothetical protein
MITRGKVYTCSVQPNTIILSIFIPQFVASVTVEPVDTKDTLYTLYTHTHTHTHTHTEKEREREYMSVSLTGSSSLLEY